MLAKLISNSQGNEDKLDTRWLAKTYVIVLVVFKTKLNLSLYPDTDLGYWKDEEVL